MLQIKQIPGLVSSWEYRCTFYEPGSVLLVIGKEKNNISNRDGFKRLLFQLNAWIPQEKFDLV